MTYAPQDPDRFRDPEWLRNLYRGNGVYDAWAGNEPYPPAMYEDAYMEGYDEMLAEVSS